MTLSNCIIFGQNGEPLDPSFVDPEDNDYRLACGSNCINRASNSPVPNDTEDVDEDGNTAEKTPDLDFLTRIVGSTVDMGAYERQGNFCDADTNDDDDVGVLDLLAVINQWGTCPSPPATCSGDVYPGPCNIGDGNVDVQDLLKVINSWGENCSGEGDVPESISDCYSDVCASLTGTDWQRCMDACIEAVCESNPEECE